MRAGGSRAPQCQRAHQGPDHPPTCTALPRPTARYLARPSPPTPPACQTSGCLQTRARPLPRWGCTPSRCCGWRRCPAAQRQSPWRPWVRCCCHPGPGWSVSCCHSAPKRSGATGGGVLCGVSSWELMEQGQSREGVQLGSNAKVGRGPSSPCMHARGRLAGTNNGIQPSHQECAVIANVIHVQVELFQARAGPEEFCNGHRTLLSDPVVAQVQDLESWGENGGGGSRHIRHSTGTHEKSSQA